MVGEEPRVDSFCSIAALFPASCRFDLPLYCTTIPSYLWCRSKFDDNSDVLKHWSFVACFVDIPSRSFLDGMHPHRKMTRSRKTSLEESTMTMMIVVRQMLVLSLSLVRE